MSDRERGRNGEENMDRGREDGGREREKENITSVKYLIISYYNS